jgi:hypothetical protein
MILVNPFAHFTTAAQLLLVVGRLPGPGHVVLLVLLGVGVFALGGWFFARGKGVLIEHA